MPGATHNGSVSLSTYMLTRKSPGRWVDSLPAEIVDEIMACKAGPTIVADWLLTLGYEGATPKKCEALTTSRNKLADA
jgi:hypothetical protein